MTCFITAKKLCNDDSCKICFNKSFVSHEKSKYFNKELNNNLNPRELFKCSNKKFYFNCIKCDHNFECSLNNVNNGKWCSYCANAKLCDKDDCQICFEKSFVSHKMALYWNYEKNNNINPRTIFKNSHKPYYFNCEKCEHIFEQQLDCINKNVGCPFCCLPPKQLCDNEECKLCFEKSFESHEKSKYWNIEKNNGVKAREVFKSSNKKFYFDCFKCGHDFCIKINNITSSNNQWCSICNNITELKVYEFIKKNNLKVKKDMVFDWCINKETKRHLPFDFNIEDYKLIIEIDGGHHFKDISHWKTTCKENQIRDIYKMKQAKKNNYSMIRIIQEDIYYNKYDWKKELLNNIKIYDKPTIIYICKNNEYDCYN